MNYIDLTSNKVWTDEQINRRLQSAIRSRVSLEDEMKAARLGRKAKPTAADKAHIKRVDDHIAACIAGVAAVQADNALLRETLAYETAEARLAEPVLDPLAKDDEGNPLYPEVEAVTPDGISMGDFFPNPAITKDADERAEAEARLSLANVKVRALVKKRKATREAANR